MSVIGQKQTVGTGAHKALTALFDINIAENHNDKDTTVTENFFRPDQKYESEQYERVKSKVFSIFESGRITKKELIISVCQIIYREHELVLEENIRSLDALPLVMFILRQYEAYQRKSLEYHQFNLSAAEDESWTSYAMHARRGIKYLMEYLCRHNNVLLGTKDDELTRLEDIASLSRIFISIEEMCSTYMRIDSYRFFYDKVELILDKKKYTYFNVPQDSDPRNKIDIRTERKEIGSRIKGRPYGIDIEDHGRVLDPAFSENLGLNYTQLINFLRECINSEANPIGVIPKDKVIMNLSKKFNTSIEKATKAINGFTIQAANLENRTLFSPKQEHRAYHRGFFEFIHKDTAVLFFSRAMAIESLDILINNACYQKLPEEWKNPTIELYLTTLSNKAGKWFEDVVSCNLAEVGINAISSVDRYRSKGKIITPPDNVGEIDFIGYLEEQNALFVIEAKNVRFNTEPRLFRDDLSKFVTGKKSYASKFSSKCQWVMYNLPTVIDELEKQGVLARNIQKVYKIMVILAPSPVEDRISEFSCVNLVKFMTIMESGRLASLVATEI